MIVDQPDGADIRFALWRFSNPVIRKVQQDHGPLLKIATEAWESAPFLVKLAPVLVMAERYALADPDRVVAERLKAAAADLSAACDWSAIARRPSHERLQQRRAVSAPTLTYDPVAAALWVTTGSSEVPS